MKIGFLTLMFLVMIAPLTFAQGRARPGVRSSSPVKLPKTTTLIDPERADSNGEEWFEEENLNDVSESENPFDADRVHFDCRPFLVKSSMKTFRLVTSVIARTQRSTLRPVDYTEGTPIPESQLDLLLWGKLLKPMSKKLLALQEAHHQKLIQKIGEEEITEIFAEFRQHLNLDDVSMNRILYQALFALNFKFGPTAFCDFKPADKKHDYRDFYHANVRVVNFAEAKTLLLKEALRIAQNETNSESIDLSGVTPVVQDTPKNPFLQGWKSWLKTNGPAEFRVKAKILR